MADANALEVRATPSFFLNGKKHEGPLTMMDVTAALSAAAKAPDAASTPQGRPADPAAQPKTGAAETKQTSKVLPQTGAAPERSKTAAKPGNVESAKATTASAVGFGTPGGGNPFVPPNASSAIVPCGVNDKPVQDPPMIQTADMHKLFENNAAVFVDVRGTGAYKEAHIPTAINATLDQLEKRIPPQLQKNKQIVLYEAGGADESCTASKTAGRILKQNGFKNVKVFKQGFEGWKQQGLPTAP
jgi:rhodanese-related sulfurtransferase